MPYRIFGSTDYLESEMEAQKLARAAGLNGYIHEPTGSPGSGVLIHLTEKKQSNTEPSGSIHHD